MLSEINKKISQKVVSRPFDSGGVKDMDFNFVHQEDVIDLCKEAFDLGVSTSSNRAKAKIKPCASLENCHYVEINKHCLRDDCLVYIPTINYEQEFDDFIDANVCGPYSSGTMPTLEETWKAAIKLVEEKLKPTNGENVK